MPFTGVEWTFQAKDLGFIEEIESDDEETKAIQENFQELEMSEITTSSNSSTEHKTKPHRVVHQEQSSALDSILEDA
jgi:precorrin-6B methylase 2